MDYIRPDNIGYNFVRGGITVSDSEDGIVNYTYENMSEGAKLTDAVTLKGLRGVVDKLDKGGTLTITVMKDTPAHKKFEQMIKIRGSMAGFLKDESESESTTLLTMISGAIQKRPRDLSTETTDFILVGNFDDTTT